MCEQHFTPSETALNSLKKGQGCHSMLVRALKTHFRPSSTPVWSSLLTISCCAARSAALYGDAFGANFRSSDVDYAGLTSLIGRFKGSGRSGSLRSFDCRIVIGGTRPDSRVIDRSLSFFGFVDFPFHAGCRPGPPVPSQSISLLSRPLRPFRYLKGRLRASSPARESHGVMPN